MLGITRFGLAKMKESVLMLASVIKQPLMLYAMSIICSLRKLVTTCLMLPSVGNLMQSMVIINTYTHSQACMQYKYSQEYMLDKSTHV